MKMLLFIFIYKNMKIIFLDIDGVLVNRNHQISIDYIDDKDDKLPVFDPKVVSLINEIQQTTNSSVVVTSTWRTVGLEKIQEIFKKRGIGDVVGITPIGFEFENRSQEISRWIYENDVEKYVIIDDMDIDGLYDNLILVDPEFGLTSNKEIIEILK
jgi:hypothetical protein